MRGLDLFCGAGGASRGYTYAGHTMVGVDINPQKRYEYPFIQAEAMDFLKRLINGEIIQGYSLDMFDFIHASPPCQEYSLFLRGRLVYERPKLIPKLRRLLLKTNKIYIIENVPGAPLNTPCVLCGTSFGLRLKRHRLFESNIPLISLPCAHRGVKVIDPMSKRGNDRFKLENDPRPIERAWREEMGVVWMTQYEARESIPPVFTHFIGGQLKKGKKSLCTSAVAL